MTTVIILIYYLFVHNKICIQCYEINLLAIAYLSKLYTVDENEAKKVH
jgi:hypothetical protein